MGSREIVLWVDERWYQALTRHAEDQTAEDRLKGYLDLMIHQLPTDVYERISQEIQAEEQRRKEEMAADQKFSAFRVTKDGETTCLRIGHGQDVLIAASKLRQHLRAPDGKDFAESLTDQVRVSVSEFDQLTGLRMEAPGKVTGVFDLDFDKGEFSYVDAAAGWRTFPMNAVSTAMYYAERKQWISHEQRLEKFLTKLEGQQIPSAGHLSAQQMSLAEEICEVDGRRLNFYLETGFDVDAVFGTHVCTAENDDTLNVYADYDMRTGQVCDMLEVDLHRADGREESVEYRLDAAEKAVLLRKMEDYCQQQTGQSLKDYSAQLMAEDMAPPVGPVM